MDKRFALRREPPLYLLCAITIAAAPRFCSVLMPATAPGMCVLYAEQLEILFPIRAFLSERRIAKARFNPGGDTVIVYPSLLHVIHVFVACNGTFPKRAIVDCANQITFPARFLAGCHEIAHAEKVALTTDGTDFVVEAAVSAAKVPWICA